jgi:hypothetical protein
LIKNFQAPRTGFGIQFTPNTPANLYVSDTVIVHNVNGQGGGVVIKPTSNGGTKAVLNRVQSYDNLFGLKVDGSTTTNPIRVTVRDSVMATNVFNGIWVTSAGADSVVFSENNALVNNQLNGALADGAKGTIFLSSSTIAANGTGVAATNSATLLSYKKHQQ